MLTVLLFQGREQRTAQAPHLAAELQRLLNQQQGAHRAYRLVHSADDAPDIDPGRRRLDQHTGVDRRVEEGELAHHALDVHAMPNLVEPVGDRVPVREQLVVAWDAEVEGASDTEERTALVAAAPVLRRRQGEVEGELAL